MAPKKKQEEKKVIQAGPTETEIELFNLEIAALNQKIARLRTSIDYYENENLRLQDAYEKLDQDRTDVISFLKKTLAVRNEEISELKEKIRGLEEIRLIETTEYKKQIADLEKNFVTMKSQLSAENKLLSGKLNTLEEFRAIRDDLMIKFERQEQNFKDQEIKYKRLVYDAEKKLIISKDKLKKDMEKRLLQLAIDYQDASELRIAASTHRILRENIAINHELDFILQGQEKLHKMREKFQHSERSARIAKELAEQERDTAIKKSVTQSKIIEQLTATVLAMKKQAAIQERDRFEISNMQRKLDQLTNKNKDFVSKISVLEQKLHEKENADYNKKVEAEHIFAENKKLSLIIREAIYVLQAVFKVDAMITVVRTQEMKDKNYLLERLAHGLAQYNMETHTVSMESLINFHSLYKKGDLGFVPIPKEASKIIGRTKTSKASDITLDKESFGTPPSIAYTDQDSRSVSLKTMPSLKLLPPLEAKQIEEQESAESLMRYSVSEAEEEEDKENEDEENIEKLLDKSKIAIQKSILKDLVVSQHSLKGVETGSRIGGFMSKIEKDEIQEDAYEENDLNTEAGDNAADGATGSDASSDTEKEKKDKDPEMKPEATDET